jgi:hypothetical protein
VVPPTERGIDDEEAVDIGDIVDALRQEKQALPQGPCEVMSPRVGEHLRDEDGMEPGNLETVIHEISSSGMFSLDGYPEVSDAERLQFFWEAATGPQGRGGDARETMNGRKERVWTTSTSVQQGNGVEPYILVSRGEDFADSFDPFFFAKTFPTLFPYGYGGPRLAEESMLPNDEQSAEPGESANAQDLTSSRNMSLMTWADIVLRRHGGRFATHHIFSFLVFNMGVRSRNRRVSMLSVSRKEYPKVERMVRSLSRAGLEAAQNELEHSGQTSDEGVQELLRSLSLYGFRQPMSREHRLSLRRKIKSLIIRYGIPAIWFTLNPNDITNPVKLRLAAYRIHDPDTAEAFLATLDMTYKRARLAISDPVSSAIFFHREISLFFQHYVKVGEDSVFGRISQYFGAVETNERGALHVHGLLWLEGNMQLSIILDDVRAEENSSYHEQIIEFVDSIFSEVS